jgi:hypothetical protein
MVRSTTLLLLLGMTLGTANAQFRVANHGTALCQIFVDANADAADKRAASELGQYLSQISGAEIPVVSGGDPWLDTLTASHSKLILVGRSTLAAGLFPNVDWAALKPEEAIVRYAKGPPNALLIAGGGPRGVLYSAFRLLNRIGVEWWTPWATDVPKDPNLSVPTGEVTEAPTLEYRDPSFHSEFDPEWAAHNFCNGGASTPELGGGVTYEGFVHTYYPLVDPKVYFPLHPEWFSLIDGKRTASNAQLCTTNPALRAFILDRVKALLKANPSANIVSVSQNDCFNYCQCDRCQALAKAEGSQAAPVIALANYVADGIKDEFPNVAVDTLAYQWSRHAPKNLKPRPNVIVRLCSIECDFGSPLDASKNKDFEQDVLDWSRLTQRLYVWDYATNFANYIEPMPDEAVLGPNLKFLSNHGVKGVFEEGDYTSNGGSMSPLKTWMLAHLMWNPNQDDRALEEKFLKGYYGKAAKPIGESIDLFTAAAAKTACTLYQDTYAPYLAPRNVFAAEQLWQLAEKEVRNDPMRLWRVKESHLALQFVFLKRWEQLRKVAEAGHTRWPISDSKSVFAQKWLEFATSPGPAHWAPITAVDEDGETPEVFVKSLSSS